MVTNLSAGSCLLDVLDLRQVKSNNFMSQGRMGGVSFVKVTVTMLSVERHVRYLIAQLVGS
jgi:hypothetical protein